jgi:hypothetical protein
MAQIIMIPKPNKDSINVRSYRPISLLPVIVEERLIPNHQFGFRSKHATVEQVHRITNKISLAFKTGKYYSTVFLDMLQASDKVWHDGLLFKIQ